MNIQMLKNCMIFDDHIIGNDKACGVCAGDLCAIERETSGTRSS